MRAPCLILITTVCILTFPFCPWLRGAQRPRARPPPAASEAEGGKCIRSPRGGGTALRGQRCSLGVVAGKRGCLGGWGCIRGRAGASPAAQHVLPPCGTSQGSFSVGQGAKLPREVESRVGRCWEVLLVHQEWEPGLVCHWIQEMVNSWFCRQLGNMSC